MFSNEFSYAYLDSYSNANRLFNINDSQNIWSSDKMCPINNNNFFNKNRYILNTSLQMSDKLSRNNRKPTGNRSETNLIVNYLPDGFFEKELFELFSKAGPIVHCHVVRNKDNKSECYGFVDFEKPIDAEKAIDMFHQYQIQNKKLKVQNAAEGLLIKEEERYRAIKGINNMGYNVEIRNAPIRWTVNDVKNIFGKYGEFLKVYENVDEKTSNVENCPEMKSKAFNVIYRYQTIAKKVIRRKHNKIAEPMWPLELELSIVGQEFVDSAVENSRISRSKPSKMRYDQMSDCSWENKIDSKFENASFGQPNYETHAVSCRENGDDLQQGVLLASNGRPILKHKDNLMHLNGDVFEALSTDPLDKWNRTIENEDSSPLFDNNVRGPCNDIKAIWEIKEPLPHTPKLLPQDIYIKTPLLPSRFQWDDKTRFKLNVSFKMENMQPTGSFKLRGMANWCYKAKLDGIQLVVSSSGGNAGLAAAYACRLLKLKCKVVVPHSTPMGIIAELWKEKAEVIQEGFCWKEAHSKAESIVASFPRISRLVHPFDCGLLWDGYESIVDELISDMKGAQLDMIVLSVGGGGMLNGIVQGITKNDLNKTTAILAMETEGSACFNHSLSANRIVSVVPNSVATSLGASSISQRTWDIYCNKEIHLFSKVCSDFEAIESCFQFLNEQNCLVEPACGASLAALYNGTLDQMAECRNCDLNIVVIVCGGRCVDIQSLLEMRQAYCVFSSSNLYEASYDNMSNYDVNDRFLNLDFDRDSVYQHQQLQQPVETQSKLLYYKSCRFDNTSGLTTPYNNNNQMCSSNTKPPIDSTENSIINKISTTTLTDKFPYIRNTINENKVYFNQYQSINNNCNPNNNMFQNTHSDHSYLVNNDMMISSPVGSQHSDKENVYYHHHQK